MAPLDGTQQKGEIAFLKCALRATEKGMILSKPSVEARYDAVLDDGERLWRAQIKYVGADTRGSVRVDLRRRSSSRVAKTRTYSAREVDALLLFVPKIDKVLFFGTEVFDGCSSLQIRLEPSRNGQARGVIAAEKFIW
jgi:hypothetical protein